MLMRSLVLLSLLWLQGLNLLAEVELEVSALAIKAPKPESVDRFVEFMQKELHPRGVNTLILRVDYDYAYRSHPELVDDGALSYEQVKALVAAGRALNIELIPQINLLGHQSWHSSLGKLLEVYPEFDETPHIDLPEEYTWPNSDGLYCKSYCPLHPEVHEIVFALVDELMDAFEAEAFHAGLDEVFYLADDRCPRCAGKDKAELFADEVNRIHDHLSDTGRELWMWGDRLLDGESTGLGMWEASANGTHTAIDLIPRDVVICDWHYERAEQTPAYFAMKGFKVISCAWNRPEVAAQQLEDMRRFMTQSNPTLADRFAGMMLTVWSPAERFLDDLQAPDSQSEKRAGDVASFDVLFPNPARP